ncbi:MAG: cation:proton antiporter [Balneolales bacterium]
MEDLNIILLIIGGIVLILGALSGYIKNRTWFSEPLIALLLGILIGPSGLDLLNSADWGDPLSILEEAARLTLAISLMAVALRVPENYVFHNWRSMAVLIGLIMPVMWITSSLIVYFFLGVSLFTAFLMGAILTPTDPVVASSIVTSVTAKSKLRDDIRFTISAESGLNDGMIFPLVMLPVLLLALPVNQAAGSWLTQTLIWETAGGLIFGLITGHLAGRILHWAENNEIIENTSFLSYSISLSLVTVGAASLMGLNDIFAVFICGLTFGYVVGGKDRYEEEGVQEAVSQFFTLPIFTLLGLALPWSNWLDLGITGLLLVIMILLFRRLPSFIILKPALRTFKGWGDVLFAGWFGPIGISTLFYATFSVRQTGNDEIWTICSLVIFASIFIHGFSAHPAIMLYDKNLKAKYNNTA